MHLERVAPGRDVPHRVNAIIEIPMHSDPVKYEIDKGSGAMVVDRFLSVAMHYPCNYGYIPHTLCEDGDPMDVLVITPLSLIPGSVIPCRPVGMLNMEDEKGKDTKILAVPDDDVCSLYCNIRTFDDLPPTLLNQIAHFFEHYKDLEAGKWVKVEGWSGVEEAKAAILASVERYRAAPVKPSF
ncbi:MAG: inorganic diphosphatase [Gammaproteobacteria bacterium]|nr:MAG: inorganic diphosphatase [Gammaproteobacteria bacterium]